MKPELFELHARAEMDHWWFVGRRRILGAVIDALLPDGPDQLIVDIGCGTGANVAAFGRTRECVGIDVSGAAIELARRRFPDHRFLVGFAPQDLGDLVERADLFLLTDVLEHVRADVELFTEVMAAAKPGALCIVTVPADPSLWSRHDVTHMHYRRYTVERLSELWRDRPIRPRVVTSINRRLLPVVRSVRTFERMLGRTLGPGGTDLSLPPAPLNRMLADVLGGEASRVVGALRAGTLEPDPRGVTLLTVLEREGVPMTARPQPVGLAAQDLNDPEA